ncbi:nitrogen fixation regulatory protein [mine drainage metagenome]|uniref:histidine kinase n=1 Tax=mine drainage metagenome TaxID=410659 RepID=A0A1J5RC33_9ZZZZ
MKPPSAYISKTISLFIIFFSCIVLAGWMLHIHILTTGFFNGVGMRFNAAICFLLSGIVIYLMDTPVINHSRKTVIAVLSLTISFAGLLTFLQFIFGWNLGIDELLIKDRLTEFHGRMGYLISFDFILTGIIFLLLLNKRKPYFIIQLFLFIIFLNAGFIIVNNYVGYSFFYNILYLNHTAYLAPIFLILLVIAVINNKQCDDMKFPFSRTLIGFFITLIVLIVLILYADFVNSKKRSESNKLIENTRDIILISQQLKTQIIDLQNKSKGYIIVAKKEYIPEFISIKKSIDSSLNQLLIRSTDNVHQKIHIDSINAITDRFIINHDSLINIRRTKGFESARRAFLNEKDNLMINEINSIFSIFNQEENEILIKRKIANEVFITNTSKIIFLFSILFFLLIITMIIAILNYQKIRNNKEKTIQQNLSLTNAVFESIQNGILVVDHKGAVVKVNDTFTKMWHIPEEISRSADDKKLLDFILDQLLEPDKFISKVTELYNHPAEESFDEIYFKDGRVFERISKPMFVGDETFGRIWSFLDITERNKAEEEKTYQLLHYKMLMQTSQDAIHILNKKGKLVEYNEAFIKHLGYTEEETSKLFVWDWNTQWNKEELLKILSDAKEDALSFETTHKLKDGTIRNVNIMLHKFSEQGEDFYYSSARDITQRKKAEVEREQFFKFFNISSDLMVIADPNGCFLKINPAGLILLGYSEEELLSKPFLDFVHPDDRQPTLDEMARQIKTGNSMNFENRYLCKDGGSKILSWQANYVAEEGITYATARDITENKLIEERIKKTNRINEFIGQTNELILLAKNEDEIYKGISKIAVETGNFVFSWIGIVDTKTKTIKPFAWAGNEDGYLKNVSISTEDIPSGNGPTGIAYRHANYYYCNDIANDPVMENWRDVAIKRGYFSSVAFPLRIDSKVVSVITMYAGKANFFTEEELQLLEGVTKNISYALNAISNRKKREETETQLQKLTQAVEQSSTSIVITNLEAEIEYVNPAFTKLTGYGIEEVIGKNPRILQSGITPTSVYPELWKNLTSKTPWHGELCNRKKNGEFYWEQAVISPIVNEQGEITNYVAVKENITEKKKAENNQILTNKILQVLNSDINLHDLIATVLKLIQEETKFSAIGLRLKEGNDFPYFEQIGFKNSFLRTENQLIARDKNKNVCLDKDGKPFLECTCGMVLSEKINHSNPLLTKAGSFYTNNSFPFLELPSDQDPRLHPRNNCIHFGYGSVAIIPVRANDVTIGTLQLNDKEINAFTEETINYFETICVNIGNMFLRKQLEHELQKSNTELRTLSNHLQTIREEERSDIAKEIHDELSQNLVAISINAAHLKNKINDPAVQAIINEQIEIANNVVKTSKTLFNSLHPSMLDELGLEAAIKWYAKTKLKSSKIQLEFRTNINVGNENISKEINLGFFRIYQETLSNILRHANATRVSVELHKTKEYLSMRISDNGSGFDTDKIDTLHHHGILGIRERALAMGGEFTINSVVGEGTTIQVKVKI